MQKTAQKRNILNKIREKINVPGAAMEGFFKPELTRIMNELRIADDNIRTVLVGQKIGDANIDPGDKTSAKDLLKSARTNFSRREYMAAIGDLGRFHKKMYDVTQYIKTLDMNVNKIHHKFLFQDLDDKQKDHIKGLREHMSRLSSELKEEYFIKEAGIMDFFLNLPFLASKRGRALRAWEKKYPTVAKDLREGSSRLLDQADSLFNDTLSLLKEMGSARATRAIDSYMDGAKKIIGQFNKFDGGDRGFKSFYQKTVQPWLVKFDEYEKEHGIDGDSITNETPSAIVPDAGELGKKEVIAPPAKMPEVPELNFPASTPAVPEQKSLFGPAGTIWSAPIGSITPALQQEPQGPKTDPGMAVQPPMEPASNPPPGLSKSELVAWEILHPKTSHVKFINSLEKLSNEDPSILAGYISKYAKLIQNTDLETAIKLFGIVKKIRG